MHDPLSTDAPRHEPAPHHYQIPVHRVPNADGAIGALKRANANVRQARYSHVQHGERAAGSVRAHLDASVEALRDIARALGVEL